MPLVSKVNNTNFSTQVSSNAGEVTVVAVFDFYGECGSVHQRTRATMESVAMYYAQYGLGNVHFRRGNKTDEVMLETDIGNVQCTPSYYFYLGDGGGFEEYYRHKGAMSAEQIKYFIEQQRG